MGVLTYFLGLEISYQKHSIFVSQAKYARDLVARAGMARCRSWSTPCLPNNHLLPTDGEPLSDPTLYRSLVGALQYLTFTRPDIASAVNTACQFMTKPTDMHMAAVKRIIRYVQGTITQGLKYVSSPPDLVAYSDADWGGDPATRRSTTGFVVFLEYNAISWQSKKQPTISRSSTKAEYRALANTAAELFWIRQVLCALQVYLPQPPLIHCDNLSTMALSSNAVFHSRIKHLDTDYHFIREREYRRKI
ncbi:secreted RxLR effector protein 161-like [Rosa chinensis]|uniref:secreted RxLR effector protein 161-like n=1 Tax=Rosa chinensis TaxID=74649 RepID=UPI001AD8DFA4|nr:secreted RxLR effector protein 161-like [Rosa chinensis]